MRKAQNTQIGVRLLCFDSWVDGKAPFRPTALGTVQGYRQQPCRRKYARPSELAVDTNELIVHIEKFNISIFVQLI